MRANKGRKAFLAKLLNALAERALMHMANRAVPEDDNGVIFEPAAAAPLQPRPAMPTMTIDGKEYEGWPCFHHGDC